VSKPNVLLISYYWPPAAGPGVQRWLKMSNYLQKNGVSVTVVTPKNPEVANLDHSLSEEVHPATKVFYTASRSPFTTYKKLTGAKKVSSGGIGLETTKKSLLQKLMLFIRANFFIPDARKGWNNFAFAQAKKLALQHSFNAIITTGPPHSTHLVGLRLKRELSIPWFADFRDPWVNIFYHRFFPRTRHTRKKDQALEDVVLREATAVFTVSPGLTAEFKNRAKRIHTLYNGYDPADMPPALTQRQEHFYLRYTGNFKPNQNALALWRALQELTQENTAFAQSFKLQLIGNVDAGVLESIKENKLLSYTQMLGYQPHQQATQYMVTASAVLFIVPQVASNNLILTGKLFEYLGSGTPLLAVGPPQGNAARLIQETGRGTTLEYGAQAKIKAKVQELFEQWQANGCKPLRLKADAVASYTREGVALQLKEILENA
jgi:hypothetical protein